MTLLRIGSRGSQLALFQANLVAARIAAAGGPPCDVVVIKTSGDRLQEAPLSDVGGKRVFVKEIEDALMAGDVDLAVHSSKDMPAELPAGLDVGATLPREDPRDAIVLPSGAGAADDLDTLAAQLGRGARIGTGSVRRIAQLRAVFPQATFEHIRGNLDTRLRKLDSGSYDLLVLAAAGLRRLGWSDRISSYVPIERCVPAPGQGIIAIEIRSGDTRALEAVGRVHDADAGDALDAERSIVTTLGGGCQLPIGAFAEVAAGKIHLHALVASLDGTKVVRHSGSGERAGAKQLGIEVARGLLRDGAAGILRHAHVQDAVPPQLT